MTGVQAVSHYHEALQMVPGKVERSDLNTSEMALSTPVTSSQEKSKKP